MTEWSDAEISRRLALAIGWSDVYYHDLYDTAYVRDESSSDHFKKFDYRDPAVIWPIAERFDCFPAKTPWDDPARSWSAFFDDSWNSGFTEYVETDTAAKAVALTVIKVMENHK